MAALPTTPARRSLPYLAGAAVAGLLVGTWSAQRRRRPLRLDSPAHGPATPALSFPKSLLFPVRLTVVKTEQVNHDTKRITFSLPGGAAQLTGVPPGSAILTSHWPAGACFPVWRPYTPISDPEARGTLELLVKRYPHGRASGHLHGLAPGETVAVRGPLPGYAYAAAAEPRDLLMVAGGAGITPIYSLATAILRAPGDRSRIQLLWGVNGTRDMVLKDDLDALEQQYPERLRVVYCVSGAAGTAEAADVGGAGEWRTGYIGCEVLSEAIERAEKAGAFGDVKGTKVFVCGPPAMQEAIAGKKGLLAGAFGLATKEVHLF